MPISSSATVLPTTDEFVAHWTSANAVLGAAGPLILAGGMDVAGLTGLRTLLEQQRTGVEVARNDVELARAEIWGGKSALLERLNQFIDKLPSLVPGSRWARVLPKAFTVSEGMGRVLMPLEEMAELWRRYEQVNPPLALRKGYALADLVADVTALKAAYQRHAVAELDLRLARCARNETQEKIRPVLKQYRLGVGAEFPEGSAVLAALPRLTPLPGATPHAVKMEGFYDEAAAGARLTWAVVTDKRVTMLQVRGVAGAKYDGEDEKILARIPVGAAREWRGNFGLGTPGAAASFKVYALTAEGHERGSKAVTVVRPV